MTSTLVVDDDPDMCWVLRVTLESCGRSVATAQSGHEALGLTVGRTFPLAFIDARLPDMDGLQLAARIAERKGARRIFLISGYYSDDSVSIVEAIRRGAVQGFFAKPFEIEAIEAVLSQDPND